MRLLVLEGNPAGRRLFVFGCRVHHFHFGLALVAAGSRLVWIDRADLPRRNRKPQLEGEECNPLSIVC